MDGLDRKRAERLMADAAIDALILLSPESFRHATGAAPGVATMWRKAGAVAALLPADPGLAQAAVVSDLFAPAFRKASHVADIRESPIWVETADLDGTGPDLPPEERVARAWQAAGRRKGFERPETFDPVLCFNHLADLLRERGLAGGRIGFEGSAISVSDFATFEAALGGIELVDASKLIARLLVTQSRRSPTCVLRSGSPKPAYRRCAKRSRRARRATRWPVSGKAPSGATRTAAR
ncbi:MAG: aminopeptidase P family N-terminal domain-containing protein [Paracoccaceae bacterium]